MDNPLNQSYASDTEMTLAENYNSMKLLNIKINELRNLEEILRKHPKNKKMYAKLKKSVQENIEAKTKFLNIFKNLFFQANLQYVKEEKGGLIPFGGDLLKLIKIHIFLFISKF